MPTGAVVSEECVFNHHQLNRWWQYKVRKAKSVCVARESNPGRKNGNLA